MSLVTPPQTQDPSGHYALLRPWERERGHGNVVSLMVEAEERGGDAGSHETELLMPDGTYSPQSRRGIPPMRRPFAEVKPFGNSTPVCGGSCVLAIDAHHSLLSGICFCFPLAAFNYVWATEVLHPREAPLVGGSGCYIPLAGANALALIAVGLMFIATAANPGVVPKEPRRMSNEPPEGYVAFVEVKGCKVLLPYCAVCNIIRPPRVSHCRYCDNCVQGFDHHCGVLGACVGSGNLSYFFAFLCATTMLALWVVACGVASLWRSSRERSLLWLCCNAFSTVAGVGFAILVGAMVPRYVKTISRGYTQREYAKRQFLYHSLTNNPFDRGCPRNWLIAMNCMRDDSAAV